MPTTLNQTDSLSRPGSAAWEIDPAHTDVAFSVKHLMISTVRGRFASVTGRIHLDERDLAGSSVEVDIDAGSIDTRQEQRDAHLRSPDFFDVAVHPRITFRSRSVEPVAGDRLRVRGELAIRGVAREVVLDVADEGRGTDQWGGQRAAFSASTTIDRRDFGLTWNQALETGGVLVSNDVKITLDVQVVQA